MKSVQLPQYASQQASTRRARALFVQREAYRWVHAPGQPPFCKGVPAGEAFTKTKAFLMDWDIGRTLADLALAAVIRFGRSDATIASFTRYYPLQRLPDVARKQRWQRDEDFARQRINGINPGLIKLAQEIPKKFPVTDDLLRGVLPAGETLAKLLDERRLFLVDYEALQGLERVTGRFQVAAIGLFWRDSRGQLMPLAIQLGQSEREAPVIFTPADEKWLWLMARTHLQCADGTYHEIVAHLLRTHLVMETFWVAAARALPPDHPLYVLLRPHFTGTIELNSEARSKMIAPGGPIDEAIAIGAEGSLTLIGQEYGHWSFADYDPYVDMERRGVLNAEILPDYYYRDDALRFYDAIRKYVESVLRYYYRSDEDVQNDSELQSWIVELISDDGGRVRGLPVENGKLNTFRDLHQIIAQILFLCSIEHAAVNNGQYDQFGFIPNTPGALYLPPPTDKSPRSEANLVYALPPAKAVGEQILLVHLLSLATLTPLGTYPEDFFVGVGGVRSALDYFRADLADIERDIADRNARLAVPYRYLDPSLVGRSIAI